MPLLPMHQPRYFDVRQPQAEQGIANTNRKTKLLAVRASRTHAVPNEYWEGTPASDPREGDRQRKPVWPRG